MKINGFQTKINEPEWFLMKIHEHSSDLTPGSDFLHAASSLDPKLIKKRLLNKKTWFKIEFQLP